MESQQTVSLPLMPPYVKILRDVTDESSYATKNIAKVDFVMSEADNLRKFDHLDSTVKT